MSKKILSIIASLVTVNTAAAGDDYDWRSVDIRDILKKDDSFVTLASALDLADLDETFNCNKRWEYCDYKTIFAPVDEAFEEDGVKEVVEKYTTDDNYLLHLKSLLLYHVIDRELDEADILGGAKLKSLYNDEQLDTTIKNHEEIYVNDAKVLKANLFARNGVIHVIDKLLLPDFVTKNILQVADDAGSFENLIEAAKDVSLDGVLGNDETLTLFAPTDEAFKKVEDLIQTLTTDQIKEVLSYHVISDSIVTSDEVESGNVKTLQGENIIIVKDGDEICINDDAEVEKGNILASNGIIHVIDRVLIPPSIVKATTPSIADIVAADDGEFDTLEAALKSVNLTEVFANKDGGPYTVFAPTDAAFNELGSNVTDLLGTESLKDMLLYHVVAGKISAKELEDGAVKTLGGGMVSVEVEDDGGILLNGEVEVKTADIEAFNGYIHVINKLLLPKTIVQVAEERELIEFVKAINIAGLREVLSGAGPFTVLVPRNKAIRSCDLLTKYDGAELKPFLEYHVIEGLFDEDDVTALDGEKVKTLNGAEILVDFESRDRYLFGKWTKEEYIKLIGGTNTAEVINADLFGSNGVIHVIDTFLFP